MKVCILAAGKGTRMGIYGNMAHKGLLPVGNKAVISHIIAALGPEKEYILAVHPDESAIPDYLTIAHPGLRFHCVAVENHDGPGSGPGQSLHECREFLKEPFYFIACDTLIEGELPPEKGNWIGVRKVDHPQQYCTVAVDGQGRVTRLHYRDPDHWTPLAFIGLAFVKDYEPFWEALASNELVAGEKQVINGLLGLLPRGLGTAALTWRDTGSAEAYEAALAHYEKNYTFQGKTTDITYRIGDRIIKYFRNPEITHQRYERGLGEAGLFVETLERRGCFFATRFIPQAGLLSSRMGHASCREFLEWAQAHLWRAVAVEESRFQAICRRFYMDKTLLRLENYNRRFPAHEQTGELVINGLACATAQSLVERLTDRFHRGAMPSGFHGDLHADNVLVDARGAFHLIDWRQTFGGAMDVGDRYYDLAKFLHTLELSVDTMDRGRFTLTRCTSGVTLDHHCAFRELDALGAFWNFVATFGYDAERIRIIDAMIFLNMAPLYDEPMAVYLYHLGRYLLQSAQDRDTASEYFRPA
ncbi:MAG: NTP transferase domain-containing protein [Magnetococcales bacterium]|nr:NTP transferase domain-containing protein [Magnetococcales bacterium]